MTNAQFCRKAAAVASKARRKFRLPEKSMNRVRAKLKSGHCGDALIMVADMINDPTYRPG